MNSWKDCFLPFFWFVWFELHGNLKISTEIICVFRKWQTRALTPCKDPEWLLKALWFQVSRSFSVIHFCWSRCNRAPGSPRLTLQPPASRRDAWPDHTGPKQAEEGRIKENVRERKRRGLAKTAHINPLPHEPARTHALIKPTSKLCHSINVSFYLVLTYLPSSAGIKASPLPPSLSPLSS